MSYGNSRDRNALPAIQDLGENSIVPLLKSLKARGFFSVTLRKDSDMFPDDSLDATRDYFTSLIEDTLEGQEVTVAIMDCSDPNAVQVICRKTDAL